MVMEVTEEYFLRHEIYNLHSRKISYVQYWSLWTSEHEIVVTSMFHKRR